MHGLSNLTREEFQNFEMLTDFGEDAANRIVKIVKTEPLNLKDITDAVERLSTNVIKIHQFAQKKASES